MAAQQVQIAETIRAMKLALKRRPDDSESDAEFHSHTNRGHKFKRSARYAREGRLDGTGGVAYRRRVRHAGYTRTTISTNPRLFDSDGEPYSPQSSEDERRGAPFEEDPFAPVHLETLLKPLTAIHELPDHPSLGVAYKSTALSHMSAEMQETLRHERDNLWRAKRLLKRFRGDADWAPCCNFEADGDMLLLRDYQEAVASDSNDAPDGVEINDMAVRTPEAQKEAREQRMERGEGQSDQKDIEAMQIGQDTDKSVHVESDIKENDGTLVPPSNPAVSELRASAEPPASEATSVSGNTHAMTTRARARSPRLSSSPSPSPSDSASTPAIHPWFLVPSTSAPDRDLGLPADESENTRKMLLLYCQKQEQIIRSLDTLFTGLQRGDRLRKSVLASAKASAHLVPDSKHGLVTEMSDGEDWYDPAEYGRLEKGKDEVEDVEEEGRRGGRRRRVVGRV